MDASRRLALARLAALAASAAAWPLAARAQERRLNLLVGFPAGGAPDTVARALAAAMQPQGWTVIVENKTGAGGRVAADATLAAAPNGGTAMIANAGMLTIFPHIYPQLRYDPLKDFAPLSTACEYAFGLAVGPAVPATVKTLADYLAWAKAHPANAQFGTPGAGTPMHFTGVELARLAKVDLHHVPYRGGAPALTDLMGGQIPAIITTLPLLLKPHQSGRVRVLAHTGAAPVAQLPEVSTFQQSGFPQLTASEMFVIVASAKVPADARRPLADALAAADAAPSVKTAYETAGFEPLTLPPAAIEARLRSESARWAAVVKATGFRAED